MPEPLPGIPREAMQYIQPARQTTGWRKWCEDAWHLVVIVAFVLFVLGTILWYVLPIVGLMQAIGQGGN